MNFINGAVAGAVIMMMVGYIIHESVHKPTCEKAGGEYLIGLLDGYCVRKDAILKSD